MEKKPSNDEKILESQIKTLEDKNNELMVLYKQRIDNTGMGINRNIFFLG